MRNPVLARRVISLALCFALQLPLLIKAQTANDLPDSDEFFQRTTRRTPDRDYTQKIEDLLKRMTLEEKVGHMTQLAIRIPMIYGIDSIHGANYVQGATLFPQEIGMAATWNPELMKRAAEIAAIETRAAAIPWSFSPVLDLGRNPLWPRFWETFGEDPYLAKVMGVAFVRGLEGTDVSSQTQVASSLKHYMGYSFPLTGRDRTPAWIPENYLREYFLPTFDAAVKAGARTIMVNSGDVNGVPGHVNKHILTDILRNELGFKGFVVSDWEDIKKLVTTWRIAATEKEATRLAVMAGIDMSMVPNDYSFADHLVALVKEGAVPQSRIDEAVRRILRVKFEIGLFDKPMPDPSLKAKFGLPEYRDVSLQAARESITLLKNTGNILPLAKTAKVLVTGLTADSLVSMNNGWTYVWQGSEEGLYPKDRNTIRKAIEAKLGAGNVTFVQGTRITRGPGPSNSTPTDQEEEVDIAAAVRAAQNVDVVVLALGEGSYCETPGNITDLTIGEPQIKLAEALKATGKPIVMVLVEGRPRIINRIADSANAILMAYNPSHEGGTAIADILFGDVNPSGKLPFTYPRTPNGLINYDHKPFETENTAFGNMAFNPQFQFGDGLSYTTFAYSDLRVGKQTISANEELPVSVVVKNTGNRAGKEAVLVYVSDLVASLSPPGKRLRRFAKIKAAPGESRTLNFKLRREDLSFIGADNKPTLEPGDFEVRIAGLSQKFTVK